MAGKLSEGHLLQLLHASRDTLFQECPHAQEHTCLQQQNWHETPNKQIWPFTIGTLCAPRPLAAWNLATGGASSMFKGPRSHRSKTLCASGCLADQAWQTNAPIPIVPLGDCHYAPSIRAWQPMCLFHGSICRCMCLVCLVDSRLLECDSIKVMSGPPFVSHPKFQEQSQKWFMYMSLPIGNGQPWFNYGATSKMTLPCKNMFLLESAWEIVSQLYMRSPSSQLTQLLGGILHDYPMSRLSDTLLQNCVAVVSKTSSDQAMKVYWESLRQGERGVFLVIHHVTWLSCSVHVYIQTQVHANAPWHIDHQIMAKIKIMYHTWSIWSI